MEGFYLDEIANKLREKCNKLHTIHGDENNIASWNYSGKYHEFLNKNGVNSKLTILKGVGHYLEETKYFNKSAESIIDHFK